MWFAVFTIIIMSCAFVVFGAVGILEALETSEKILYSFIISSGVAFLFVMCMAVYDEGRNSIINSKVCTNCSCFYEEEEKFCPECGEELTFVIPDKKGAHK